MRPAPVGVLDEMPDETPDETPGSRTHEASPYTGEEPPPDPAPAPPPLPALDPAWDPAPGAPAVPTPVGRWTRLLHYVVDAAAIWTASLVVSAVVATAWFVMTGAFDEDDTVLEGIIFGLTLLVTFAYYATLEAGFGRTFGKVLAGTRVVALSGGPPTLGQVLGRTAARFIPLEPLSIFIGRDGVPWHDSLSGTRVVRDSGDRS
ncbi:MAG: RDD family protein [Vicinamibacterales bacterium]